MVRSRGIRYDLLGYFLVLILAVGYLLYGLGGSMWPLILSGLLAYMLSPVVEFCEGHGINRTIAVLVLLIGVVGLILVAVSFFIPFLIQEIQIFVSALPGQLERLITTLQLWAKHYGVDVPLLRASPAELLHAYVPSLSVNILKPVTYFIQNVFVNVSNSLIGLINFVLCPVFFFFVLNDYTHYTTIFYTIFPESWRAGARDYMAKVDTIFSGYIRGQLVVALIMSVYYGLGLAVVGLPFGWLIGFIAGILSFIPYLGIGMGVLASTVMIVTNFTGWWLVGLVAGVFLLGQALEGWFITPRLVGKRVGLNALTVLLSIIIGGNFLGLMGMIVAIPFAGVLKMTLAELKQHRLIPPNG